MLSTPIQNWLKRKTLDVASIDPERIYVENVRSFFGINHRFAKYLCELAVNEGYFEKQCGARCPNSDCNRIIATAGNLESLPPVVHCESCLLDEQDSSTFSIGDCKIQEYYVLVK